MSRIPNPESRIPAHASRIPKPESRIPNIKRVHVVARGMRCRNIQRIEIVIGGLDFRPRLNGVTKPQEDVLDLPLHARDGMNRAERAAKTGEGEVGRAAKVGRGDGYAPGRGR